MKKQQFLSTVWLFCLLLSVACGSNNNNNETVNEVENDSAAEVVEQPTDAPEPTDEPAPVTEVTDQTLFTVDAHNFSIVLNHDWREVDLEGEMVQEVFDDLGEANDSLTDLFTNEYVQNLAANGIKFYAMNINGDFLDGTQMPTINVLVQDLPMDLSLEEYAKLNVDQINEFFALTSPLTEESVQLGSTDAYKIEYGMDMANGMGQNVSVTNTQYLIPDGARKFVIVTLATPQESVDAYLEAFTAEVESFRLLSE